MYIRLKFIVRNSFLYKQVCYYEKLIVIRQDTYMYSEETIMYDLVGPHTSENAHQLEKYHKNKMLLTLQLITCSMR